MATDERILAGAGLAAAGLGALAAGLAHRLGRPQPQPAQPGPAPPGPGPEPDPILDDPEAEPWEIEAAREGPVDADIDDEPEGPDAEAVGSGSPLDLCVYETPVLGNPQETPIYCISDPLSEPSLRPVDRGAPQAPVPVISRWPLVTRAPGRLVTSYRSESGWRGYSGRAFGAKRARDDGGTVRHAGVDLFARKGDLVVAPEDGRVIAVLPFYHGSWAIYLRTQNDLVLNLGEIEPKSYREFKIRPGVEVKKGDPLARVGKMHKSSMMHFEAYDAAGATDDDMVATIRAGGMQWTEEQPPPRLLDPSSYLLLAGARTWQQEQAAEA